MSHTCHMKKKISIVCICISTFKGIQIVRYFFFFYFLFILFFIYFIYLFIYLFIIFFWKGGVGDTAKLSLDQKKVTWGLRTQQNSKKMPRINVACAKGLLNTCIQYKHVSQFPWQFKLYVLCNESWLFLLGCICIFLISRHLLWRSTVNQP